MNVLVIDTIAPEGIAYLTEHGFTVDQVSSKVPREELLARVGDYEAIVTRSSTAVTAEFLARARRLRITTKGVEIESGIFAKRIEVMEAWRIQDVTFRQSLLDRILGITGRVPR